MQVYSDRGKNKIIFMGTPEFAVPSLKALIDNRYNICAVVTAPDKPAGRGQKLRPSPVKEFARCKNMKILQPENLKDAEFIRDLKSFNADLQVVVAFKILPEIIWNMPPLGTFNLHASLLPHYRGAAPINWAIINGETETGITTFFIDNNIDTGNIILQEKIPIPENENAGSLHDIMMNRGAQLVLKTTELIISGKSYPTPQNKLSYSAEILKPAPKIRKSDCKIDWDKPGKEIVNFIRGLSPYPTAFSFLKKSDMTILVKIFETEFIPVDHNLPGGNVISDNKSFLNVSVRDGYINIKSIQAEGRKRMEINNFLAGYRDICNFKMI